MTRSSGFFCWFALAGLALLGSPARALAAVGDEAAARALFLEGRKLVDEGDYADACPKFEESLRLDPGTGTSFNLADCFEHVGRTASAWARFLDVAAASKAADQPDRELVARARAAKLEPLLARLTIEVPSPAPGLVVERDGVPVGTASFGVPVPVDPGEHALVAKAPGKRTWTGSASVGLGPGTVMATVPALEDAPPEPAPHVAPAPSPSAATPALPAETPSRWTLPVVGLAALSTAALATSVVFAVQVQSENKQAKGLCPESNCATKGEKTQHDELVADAHRDVVVAYVGAGVGAAALLTAAYLWWSPFGSERAGPRAKTAWIRPSIRGLSAELEVAW